MATYWIADPNGIYARVDTREQRDLMVGRHFGWRDATEPGPCDRVCVVHAEVGSGQLPYGAITGVWADRGWKIGPPPELAALTPEPATAVDRPSKQTKAAAGGTSEEK